MNDERRVITEEQLLKMFMNGDVTIHGRSGMKNILSLFNSLPAAQAEKKDWIAYKSGDKVMEDVYLVTIISMAGARWRNVVRYSDGKFRAYDGDITAYMPLPAPYNKNGV